MTELNESTLAALPSNVATPAYDRTDSNAASPISAWAISIARIKPSTSTAVWPCLTKGLGHRRYRPGRRRTRQEKG